MDDQLMSQLLFEIRELKQTHQEILQILSIMVHPQIVSCLSHIFSDPKELMAYKLTNGNRSSREISSLIGVSHTTITKWWKTWDEQYKIVESEGNNKPYKSTYSIPDLVSIFGRWDFTKE